MKNPERFKPKNKPEEPEEELAEPREDLSYDTPYTRTGKLNPHDPYLQENWLKLLWAVNATPLREKKIMGPKREAPPRPFVKVPPLTEADEAQAELRDKWLKYLLNLDNLKADWQAFAKAANKDPGLITAANLDVEADCGIGENLSLIKYLRRVNLVFNFRGDWGVVIGSIKKLLRLAAERKKNAAQPPAPEEQKQEAGSRFFKRAMEKAYFNPDNIKKDLEAYAQKDNCSISRLTTGSMVRHRVICANGELILGTTYLGRAAVALGIFSSAREAFLNQVIVLDALKRLAA